MVNAYAKSPGGGGVLKTEQIGKKDACAPPRRGR